MVTAVVTAFIQALSRSTAAIELLGNAFGGIVVSDRFSAYNHLPTQQRQLCWAHLIRDLVAIAERPGASAEFGAQLLGPQQQLFGHWHRYKDGTIDWPSWQQSCRPIHQAFEAALQRVVELGYQRGERSPWASTVRTCQHLLKVADGLWTFLETRGIEPTNNAAERALRQSVIQRNTQSRRPINPVVPSAVAACSRSAPPCGNRAAMSGSSLSRPGSPMTAVGWCHHCCRIAEFSRKRSPASLPIQR